jgi:hypothetical protein
MGVTIKINGVANSLVHKGSNGISVATLPDVCKTPTPGGPVPLPYPNISQSATLAKGSTTVKADGGNMIANKGSEFSVSNGDNPGVAGGIKSSTFMKESTWITYSFDVKIQGKNACRLTDKKFQNHGNTVDMGGNMQPPVSVTPTDSNDKKIICECCGEEPHSQAQKNGEEITEKDFYLPPKLSEKQKKYAKEVLEMVRAGPCKDLLPPEKPNGDPCNKYYRATTAERKAAREKYSAGGRNPLSDPIGSKPHIHGKGQLGHRVPVGGGGCPTGTGNLHPVTKECVDDEKFLGDIQSNAVNAI